MPYSACNDKDKTYENIEYRCFMDELLGIYWLKIPSDTLMHSWSVGLLFQFQYIIPLIYTLVWRICDYL